MKSLKMLALMLTLALSSTFAHAGEIQAPLWDCTLTFKAKGGGFHLLIGKFQLTGPGRIVCADVAGNVEEIPVIVKMGGAPVALKLAVGRMKVAGIATGIGIAGSPEALLGDYVVAGVQGAFIGGAGAQLALHAADRAVTLNAAVQAVAGLGVNVGIDTFEIIDARE